MLNAALSQAKPIMVIAMTTAAITQAAADDPEQVEKEGDEGHRDAATDDDAAHRQRSWSSQ